MFPTELSCRLARLWSVYSNNMHLYQCLHQNHNEEYNETPEIGVRSLELLCYKMRLVVMVCE